MKKSLLFILSLVLSGSAWGAPPLTLTAEQDHRNMMEQLDIRGGLTYAPNMKWFIQWADRNSGHTPPP